MMDTILDIGLNDANLSALVAAGGERFALDCYRRLIQMHGEVVEGIKDEAGDDPVSFCGFIAFDVAFFFLKKK